MGFVMDLLPSLKTCEAPRSWILLQRAGQNPQPRPRPGQASAQTLLPQLLRL